MKAISELIVDIQNIASIPLGDEDRWNTATLVSELNNVMLEKVVPDILRFGSEYFVFRKAQSANTSLIPIPSRAYGRLIREIKYLQANGERRNEQNIPQITLPNADNTVTPLSVFMQNDAIVLHKNNDAYNDGQIVLYYFLKPSTIVNETTQFAPISNISGSTITTSSTGAALSTYCGVGQTKLFDVLRKSTGAIIEHDIAITRSATNTYSASLDVASYQSGGFPVVSPYSEELYLVPAGQSQFSTLSDDFDKLLVYHTVSKIFESQGDFDALTVNEQRIKDLNAHYGRIFGNRISGEPTKAIDRQNIGRSIRRNSRTGRFYNE